MKAIKLRTAARGTCRKSNHSLPWITLFSQSVRLRKKKGCQNSTTNNKRSDISALVLTDLSNWHFQYSFDTSFPMKRRLERTKGDSDSTAKSWRCVQELGVTRSFSYPPSWHTQTGGMQPSSLLFRVNPVWEKWLNPPLNHQAFSGMYWEKREGAAECEGKEIHFWHSNSGLHLQTSPEHRLPSQDSNLQSREMSNVPQLLILLPSVNCTQDQRFIYEYVHSVRSQIPDKVSAHLGKSTFNTLRCCPGELHKTGTEQSRRKGGNKSKRTKCLLDIPQREDRVLLTFSQWYPSGLRIGKLLHLVTCQPTDGRAELQALTLAFPQGFPEFPCTTQFIILCLYTGTFIQCYGGRGIPSTRSSDL